MKKKIFAMILYSIQKDWIYVESIFCVFFPGNDFIFLEKYCIILITKKFFCEKKNWSFKVICEREILSKFQFFIA